MAFPQGINFRDTTAFVTDGANESVEDASAGAGFFNCPTYPRTTAEGNTVGWEGTHAITARDRKSTNDRRIAGFHADQSPNTDDFRIDLPASGAYNIRLGAGDGNYAANVKIELFDTTSSLGVLCSGSTGAANSFKDAADATYTAANWPASNALVSKTFTTSICRFRNGDGTNNCDISHVYIESAGEVTQPFVIGPVRVASRTAGPMVLRSKFRWNIPNTTPADVTTTNPGPSPVLLGNPRVGPPVLRRQRQQSRTWATGGLLNAYILNAATGTYILTGANSSLLFGHLLNAGTGTYTLSGKNASTLRGFLLKANAGAYTVTGGAATLLATRLLNAATGSYLINGSSASLLKGSKLSASSGSYNVNGNSAQLLKGSKLSATAGAYNVSGNAAATVKGFLLQSGAGAYALSGANAVLVKAYVLPATAGSYTLSGKAVTFLYSASAATVIFMDLNNGHPILKLSSTMYIDLVNGHILKQVV